MPWITPKQDWAVGNVPNVDDLNRIEGNTDYIYNTGVFPSGEWNVKNFLKVGNSNIDMFKPLSVGSDTDISCSFGRVKTGSPSGLANQAIFSHYDYFNSTSYALRQNNEGFTLLNSHTGRAVYIRVGASNRAIFGNDQIDMYKPLNCTGIISTDVSMESPVYYVDGLPSTGGLGKDVSDLTLFTNGANDISINPNTGRTLFLKNGGTNKLVVTSTLVESTVDLKAPELEITNTATVHSSSITVADVYTALESLVPNVGDKCSITGGTNSVPSLSYMERTGATTLQLYGMSGASAVLISVSSGGVGVMAISVSTIAKF